MTEIEIIKELFRAFSTKEEICVVLADGSSRSGEVCSFDGEKILLGGEEIAVGSIVSVGKDEAIPAQPILETVTEETHTGFISALQNGDKEEVERYFANPELLMAEGFTDQEVDAICRKKSNPIPWSDDERNAKYNQARRVYEILGTKDGIAQQLFEAALSTNLPSKVEKKVISALLDIYCSDSPEKLLAFWDEYQDKLLQGSFWSFRLAKALVSLREFSKLNDIVNTIPSDSDFFKKVSLAWIHCILCSVGDALCDGLSLCDVHWDYACRCDIQSPPKIEKDGRSRRPRPSDSTSVQVGQKLRLIHKPRSARSNEASAAVRSSTLPSSADPQDLRGMRSRG